MTIDMEWGRAKLARIRDLAKTQRERLRWSGVGRVDPLGLVDCREIWTLDGPAAFRLEFVSADEDRTEPVDGGFLVSIGERTRTLAMFGDGNARTAIARQVGHAALAHHRRRMDFDKETLLRQIFPHESEAELQAGRNEFEAELFAVALLVEDDMARRLDMRRLSVEAGVSSRMMPHYYHLFRGEAA